MTQIREICSADKAQWVELRKALWPECPEARHLLEVDQLLRSNAMILVAEGSNGQIVGFAEISVRQDHVEGTSSAPVAYLEGWYVVPSHRGLGLGRELIEQAAAWAREAGFSELASDAEIQNEHSIQAHFKLGFREVGRSVHFVRSL